MRNFGLIDYRAIRHDATRIAILILAAASNVNYRGVTRRELSVCKRDPNSHAGVRVLAYVAPRQAPAGHVYAPSVSLIKTRL
jgi:hypothetical protein